MNFAGRGGIQRAQQVEQRAFAGSALPDNRQKLSVLHFEIDPQQHRNIERAFAIVLFQIHRREVGLRSIGWQIMAGEECRMRSAACGVPTD